VTVVTMPQPAPQIEYVWIKPDDVTHEWDLILPGLEVVAQHGDHWRPEDVYMALRQGAANLHVIRTGGRYSGFIVAKPSYGYDGPVLHVWAAYAVPGMPSLRKATRDQLRQWARDMGARRITFTSPRKGWERLVRQLGFEPTLTIYEQEV
jgi:hypothetical protein